MILDSVKTAMQQTNDFFCSTVIKGRDFAALNKVYTARARILPPGADLIEGREHIIGFWKMAVEGFNIQDASLTSVNSHQSGDCVIEIGRAKLFLPEGAVLEVKYVVEWLQEDGTWKWHTDIWNMNA